MPSPGMTGWRQVTVASARRVRVCYHGTLNVSPPANLGEYYVAERNSDLTMRMLQDPGWYGTNLHRPRFVNWCRTSPELFGRPLDVADRMHRRKRSVIDSVLGLLSRD